MAISRGQYGGRRSVRGDCVVLIGCEPDRGPNARAWRQRRVPVLALRGRPGRRSADDVFGRSTAAAWNDGRRYRAPKLWPLHRHRPLVHSSGVHHAVLRNFLSNGDLYFFLCKT